MRQKRNSETFTLLKRAKHLVPNDNIQPEVAWRVTRSRAANSNKELRHLSVIGKIAPLYWPSGLGRKVLIVKEKNQRASETILRNSTTLTSERPTPCRGSMKS